MRQRVVDAPEKVFFADLVKQAVLAQRHHRLCMHATEHQTRSLLLAFLMEFIERVLRMIRRNQYKRRLPVIAKLTDRTMDRDFRYPRDWGT